MACVARPLPLPSRSSVFGAFLQPGSCNWSQDRFPFATGPL